MGHLIIEGGRPLSGAVRVHGAKNSVLPILAAALLPRGESVIHNCPDLTDVTAAVEILRALGCRVRRSGTTLTVDAPAELGHTVPDGPMGRMRASVLFLGALLGRTGRAEACWPGGCALGARPIDLHLRAFRALGAQVREDGDRLVCAAESLHGRRICFPFPSVGATEDAMLAAVGAQGVTILENAAREPELVDLQGFLRALGAEVAGAGTERIVVCGGRPLRPGTYTVMADRIVAATYAAALAATGGAGALLGTDGTGWAPMCDALARAGCTVCRMPDRVELAAPPRLHGIGPIETGPWPGFPTDAQPLLTAALAAGEGETLLTETVFDRRFGYVAGLRAMGADIALDGRTARIHGVGALHGADVTAGDLRGGAALTVAALAAGGGSTVRGLAHIERGYASLAADLSALGGRIRRHEG